MTKNEGPFDCSLCRGSRYPLARNRGQIVGQEGRPVGNELEAVMIAINIEPSQSPDNASHTLELHG